MLHIMNTPLAFCEQNFFFERNCKQNFDIAQFIQIQQQCKSSRHYKYCKITKILLFVTHNKINFYPAKSGALHICLFTLHCQMGTIYPLLITTHNHRQVFHDQNFHHRCNPGHLHGHIAHHQSCHPLHLQGHHLLHQVLPCIYWVTFQLLMNSQKVRTSNYIKLGIV